MKIAHVVAERSTCDRARVGCVLVRDKKILSTGFNGSPKGLPHCNDDNHLMIEGHCLRTVHAEANAIIQCALHGVSSNGSHAYVTHFPCIHCSKMLINAGVIRVVYDKAYRISRDAMDFFRQSRILLDNINEL
jgi:dCMP deaminase